MTETATPAKHPAPFSPEIIDRLSTLIPRGARIHDPYAGEGVRLGALADERGWTFSGTELEAPFIIDKRVVAGDATDPSTYPTVPYRIVTSPVYPNGVADHWKAADPSRRRTYRAARAAITGRDRPLADTNMGRYGHRGTGPNNPKRLEYWRLARATVSCWQGATVALVNVSDFMARGLIEPVVEQWAAVLAEVGRYDTITRHEVKTRRDRGSANADKRVEHEVILEARRMPRELP